MTATAGSTSGGTDVGILGSSVSAFKSVDSGTSLAIIFNATDTQVDVMALTHAAGTVPIGIMTPGGSINSLKSNFQPDSAILKITPVYGPLQEAHSHYHGLKSDKCRPSLLQTQSRNGLHDLSDRSLTAVVPSALTAGVVGVAGGTYTALSSSLYQHLNVRTVTAVTLSSGS